MSKYILSLDQGTTSTRAILFDGCGKIVATEQKELKQHYPLAGWVEHEPREIYESAVSVIRGVMEKTGTAAGDVAAMGITCLLYTSDAADD